MADWLVEPATDPSRFPVLHHRHPNGIVRAERERTPQVEVLADGRRIERWTYACACGEVQSWERRRGDS